MTPIPRVTAPELPIDAARTLRKDQILERTIVANLIAHLANQGWTVLGVHDGELIERMTDTVEAMNLIFDLDMSQVHFGKGETYHVVLLVMGNGIDIISDYTLAKDDADGFDAAMRSFNAEAFGE